MQPKRRIEARAWRDFIVPAQIVEAERDREFPAVLPSADRGAMRTSGSVRQYLVRATVRRVSPSSITAVDAGAVYERLHRTRLRDDGTTAIAGLFGSDHKLGPVVVFLADVFEQFRSGGPLERKTCRPGSRVGAWVVDGDLVFQRSQIHPRQAFDEVKSVGVRQRVPIHPGPFVKADRVDDQAIAFPAPDGVSVIAWNEILSCRMRPPIHINNVKAMGSAIVENENALKFREVQNFKPVRCSPFSRSR